MRHWDRILAALRGLDVISPQFVIGTWIVVTLAVVGVAVLLRRQRGRAHGWLRYGLSGFLVLTTALVATATSVNAHYGYLPTVDDVAQAASSDRQWLDVDQLGHLSGSTLRQAARDGRVFKLPIPDDRAHGFAKTTAVAYLPPQYFADRTERFPVVYLFHGSPGQASDWFHAGHAEQSGRQVAAAGHPAIFVAAPVSGSWTDDPECVDGAKEKVETHFFHDVLPTVDAAFRTQPDRAGRTFAGMSAGGYCALNLGLRHSAAVSTIVDLSGDTVPTHTGGAASLFGRGDPNASAEVAANSPPSYVPTMTPDQPMRVWLDSGTADTSIEHQLSAMSRLLAPKVSEVVWRVRPGGHTYWVWTAAMRQAMPWALGAPPAHPGHDRSRPGP